MNKLAAEQNAIVGAMQKIASANGLPLTYPVAQKIAELHQYSPVLIMKTAFDITELATNPAAHSILGALGGGGLGALMAPKGYGLAGFGLGAGLGAGAGYLGSPYINQALRNYLPASTSINPSNFPDVNQTAFLQNYIQQAPGIHPAVR